MASGHPYADREDCVTKLRLPAICIAWAFASAGSALAQESPDSMIREYRDRLQASALKQAALDAGGDLKKTRVVSAAKLLPSLKALFDASDRVVIAQIVRSDCQLAPSGVDAITMYGALVLRNMKGSRLGQVLDFSVPVGMVAFDRTTRASVSVPGFRPMRNGGRYVLFLRWSEQEEKQTTPALRLAGEGVQGAFELDDETVMPAFTGDVLHHKYHSVSASAFLAELQSLNQKSDVDAAEAPRHPTAMSLAGAGGMPAQDGDWKTSGFLTPAHLQDVGFHLPSYMASIGELMRYQGRLPTHQELSVEWDSLPGQPAMVLRQDVEGAQLSSDFVLLDRRQNIPGGSGKCHYAISSEFVVIAAITSKNQVRNLCVMPDGRDLQGESWDPKTPKIGSSAFVIPKATILFRVPDDPEVKTVVFMKPFHRGNGDGWRLEKVGQISLESTSSKRN